MSIQNDNQYCTYEFISSSQLNDKELCQTLAKGYCDTKLHYANFFSIYYCKLQKNMPLYLLITIPALLLIFLWTNYIRRQFLARPILKLRKSLGLPGYVSEVFLVPIAFGIVPIFVRLQGAQKNLDFSFNLGATLGGLWTIMGFVVGICAMILRISKRYDLIVVTLSHLFVAAWLLIIQYIGHDKKIGWEYAALLIGLYFVYFGIFCFRQRSIIKSKNFKFLLNIFFAFFSFERIIIYSFQLEIFF